MPTGSLHIGNYLGAIKQWISYQDHANMFILIANLEAITTPQDPDILLQNTYELVATLLACGIDPEKTVLFLQSDVSAHAELFWILNTITPVGELERMTQYKEKRNMADAMAGLLNYPVLQAADILLYQPDSVPVGEDQLQHVELTRELARRFNNKFGDVFVVPRAAVDKTTARIMGLDDPTKKMSKSAASPRNYITLLDSPDEIRKKIKTAVTDSGKEVSYDRERKPALANLIAIHSGFSGLTHTDIQKKYAGKGYAEFKDDMAELLIEKLAPIQKKYEQIRKNEKKLKEILREGGERAKKTAGKTLEEVKKRIGFVLIPET